VPPAVAQFAALERLYYGLAVARTLIAGTLVALPRHRSGRSPQVRRSRLDEVDAVNDADHRGIYR